MVHEPRKAGSYNIIQSFDIGQRNIVIGEDLNAEPCEQYMCAYCSGNISQLRYDEVIVSGDYCEIVKIFGERISADASRIRSFRSTIEGDGIDPAPLWRSDCTAISDDDNLTGKVIVVRPEILRPEYRTAAEQIRLCVGGFGASPRSRGTACYCESLYYHYQSRIERDDILGTLKPERLPQWAKRELERYKREHRQKSGKEER